MAMNFLNSPATQMWRMVRGQGQQQPPMGAPQPMGYTPEQEAQARQAGYKNMEELIARQKFLEMQRNQPSMSRPESLWEKAKAFWNDPDGTLKNMFSWHPSNTIGRAGNALKDANER